MVGSVNHRRNLDPENITKERTMKSFAILSALCFVSSTSLFAQDGPGQSQVKIGNVSYSGSGCPQGSIGSNISDDGEAFTLIFDDYTVEKIGNAAERRTCSISIDLGHPAGWRYALVAAHVRGYATLDAGLHGQQTIRVKGAGEMINAKLKLSGPYDDNFQQSKEAPVRQLSWSKCSKGSDRLRIDTAIMLTGGRGDGVVTVDSLDGDVRQKYSLAWQRCDGSAPYVAVCHAVSQSGKVYEVSASGTAASAEKARDKAGSKAKSKCSARSGGACKVTSCEVGAAT